MNDKKLEFDVVVVGGGMAGVCAALASAREGVRTALIQDRPVLGGNASSEIRMHICGANMHGKRADARETGILEELMLKNRRRNPQHSFSVLDTTLWETVRYQENLTLMLNTRVLEVQSDNNQITGLKALQMTTETVLHISGTIYMDCTGDGMVAAEAGAQFRQGREGKEEFQESHAPDAPDSYTMGSTLMFKAVDMGYPVPFERPSWAYEIDEERLKYRGHSVSRSEMEHYGIDSGYWWIELGGTQDTIQDGEEIKDELLKTVYGIWDHIKNGGEHGAQNYALDWIQFLPGKRESRRIEGDYILKQQDLQENRKFDDVVAYGGWPMDMHPVEGFHYTGEPTDYIDIPELYGIPYRCYYSKNTENLMMAGRNISVSHMAFGSVRVMGTCAVGGQAAGTAAAMAFQYGVSPRQIGIKHISELQQKLLKNDCYIPGVYHQDQKDLAKKACITVSSQRTDGQGENVLNGVTRTNGELKGSWISEEPVLDKNGQWLELSWEKPQRISELRITFDTNLSLEIVTSLSKATQSRQKPGLPDTLVRRYQVELLEEGKCVWNQIIQDNGLRQNVLTLDKAGDCVRITVMETWGDSHARISEVRAYGEG